MSQTEQGTMKKKILIGLAILILCAVAFGIWKEKSPASVSYREATVKRGDVNVSILATGTVQPENRLEIKPPIAGRVETVIVKEGQKVVKGQILAWLSSTERATMLDAVSSKGPEELKKWEELYRPTPVMAPISGTIILQNVESGQTFTATDAILVMSDRLTVKAQVDETDIAKIQLKQAAKITLDAYPDQRFTAQVDQIAFDAKTVNNVTTYIVDVLPEHTPDFMRSGMTANVTFFEESRKNVLVVPSEAVKIQDGKSTVIVRGEDGKTLEKEIETGLTDGKRTEVISGLTENSAVLMVQLGTGEKRTSGNSNPFSPMGSPRPHGASGGR